MTPAPDATPVMRVRGLRRHYPVSGGMFRQKQMLRAVEGINFDLHAGETLAVVGESGSGKSTLGRLCALIEEPTAGKIELDGVDVTRMPQEERRTLHRHVQMIFQNPFGSLNPRKTVAAELEAPLRFNTRSTPDEWRVRVEEMLVKAEKVFLHILNEEAGSCNETFQQGWKMDCDPDTGEVLPERLVDDGKGGKRGMRADDFWKHPNSVECGHTKEEVISGRFYTTFGFKPINIPLRDPKRKNKKGKIFKPVLYPVITYHLNEFIKKCRTLAANSDRKNVALDLYRGMSNVCLQDGFMKEGGSELAPMSTTAELVGLRLCTYTLSHTHT